MHLFQVTQFDCLTKSISINFDDKNTDNHWVTFGPRLQSLCCITFALKLSLILIWAMRTIASNRLPASRKPTLNVRWFLSSVRSLWCAASTWSKDQLLPSCNSYALSLSPSTQFCRSYSFFRAQLVAMPAGPKRGNCDSRFLEFMSWFTDFSRHPRLFFQNTGEIC